MKRRNPSDGERVRAYASGMAKCAVRGCDNDLVEVPGVTNTFWGVQVCWEHPKDTESYQQAPDGTLIASPNDD
jgi:hypothetical protein